MGIFDFLTESGSEQETESQKAETLKREIEKESTQTSVATTQERKEVEAISTGETTAQQTALATSLSEENTAILDRVIQELSGKQSGADALGQLSEQLPDQLSDTLAQLVAGSGDFDAETVRIKEGLVSSARNEFERGTGRQIRVGSDAALGSRLGSTSQLIADEAQVNLSAQLAGLGAGVDERRSVERRNQLLATLQGLSSGEKTAAAIEGDPLTQLLQALQVASGARKETVSTGAQQTSEVQTQISESKKQADELIEQISKLVENAQTNTTASSRTTGTETASGLDVITGIASAFSSFGSGFANVTK